MIIVLIFTFLLPILLLLVMAVGALFMFRSWGQTLNWEASFILASYVAFLGYFRIHNILAPPLPIPVYLYWGLKIVAILCPTCMVVAWLRWTGVRWWQTLPLFPLVPVGVFTIWLMSEFPFAS